MASPRKPGRRSGKVSRAPGKAGGITRRALCMSVFSGAAAALLPASCSSPMQTGTGGAGGTGGASSSSTGSTSSTTSSTGIGGTGGASTGTGTGGMPIDAGDAGDELDGTIVDLDGDADAPYIPPDGGSPDADVS